MLTEGQHVGSHMRPKLDRQRAPVAGFKSRNAPLQNSLNYFTHTARRSMPAATTIRTLYLWKWEGWQMPCSG